jgi:hypothetical protein
MTPKRYAKKTSVPSDFPGDIRVRSTGGANRYNNYIADGHEPPPQKLPGGFRSTLSPGRMAGAAAGIGGLVGGGAALYELLSDMDETAPLSDPGMPPQAAGPPAPKGTPSAPQHTTHVSEASLQKAPGKTYKKAKPRPMPMGMSDGMWGESGKTDWLGDGLQEPTPDIQRALPAAGQPTQPFDPYAAPPMDPMEQRINERLRYRKR